MKKAHTTEKKWKNVCSSEIFWWMFCQPICILFCFASWKSLYSLCMYGRIRHNALVLAGCLAFWMVYLVIFLIRRLQCRSNTAPFFYHTVTADGDKLVFRIENYETDIRLKDVRHYREKKKLLYLVGKGNRFYVSHLPQDEKEADFVKLKLSSCGIRRRFFWKVPAAVCVMAITLWGAAGVTWAGMPYNGRLSWFLQELRGTRWISLEHNNVMETGIDGVLSDIRRRVELTETLSLVNSFNLHFGEDGTIHILDTFVNGFNKDGEFVDSYLISYDDRKSDKLRIDLHGSQGGDYEEEKDLGMLVQALRVIPLDMAASRFDQKEFGILYYGRRTWHTWDDNVIYINSGREILDAKQVDRPGEEHSGYSVSVFCPQDESIPPYRYLYVGDEEWEMLEEMRIMPAAQGENETGELSDQKTEKGKGELSYYSPL